MAGSAFGVKFFHSCLSAVLPQRTTFWHPCGEHLTGRAEPVLPVFIPCRREACRRAPPTGRSTVLPPGPGTKHR